MEKRWIAINKTKINSVTKGILLFSKKINYNFLY